MKEENKRKKKDEAQDEASERAKRNEEYAMMINILFSYAVTNILNLYKTIPTLEKGFMYSFDGDSVARQRRVNEILNDLKSASVRTIKRGIYQEWDIANKECDEIIASAMGRKTLDLSTFHRWTDRNQSARDAFFKRRERGLNLSDRIWKSVKQLREEMEIAMTISIEDGDSASSMSRKIREYLKDPDLMFRRFRYKIGEEDVIDPETGETIGKKPIYGLKWKKKIRDEKTGKIHFIDYDRDSYKTGVGVYKSSAKNAMRVARTETNIAYRMADHHRWQQMEFVIGQRIQVSRSHKEEDICDKLQGDYPKDFVFTGWHPQCYCYATPILISEDEMAKVNEAFLKGESYEPKENQITEYPKGFREWIADNADKIVDSRRSGKSPYFIKDNPKIINEIIKK